MSNTRSKKRKADSLDINDEGSKKKKVSPPSSSSGKEEKQVEAKATDPKSKKRKPDSQELNSKSAKKKKTSSSKSGKDEKAAPQEIVEKPLNGDEISKLSENEHKRYFPASAKVAHAVLVKKGSDEIAYQFAIPAGTDPKTPLFRPIQNIRTYQSYAQTRYRAETPNGTEMFATRFIDAEFQDSGKKDPVKMRIANFSPLPQPKDGKPAKKEPFYGSKEREFAYFPPKENKNEKDKTLYLFNPDLEEDRMNELKEETFEILSKGMSAKEKDKLKQDIYNGAKDLPVRMKGGRVIKIDPQSVIERDKVKTRTPDQKTVMDQQRAVDAYQDFLSERGDELSDTIRTILKKTAFAEFNNPKKDGDYRGEWGHVEVGYGLTPLGQDPQVKENLAAMPKWANTRTLPGERTLKWHALNRPNAEVTIDSKCDLLLDTDIMQKLHWTGTVKENNRQFTIKHIFNPFVEYVVQNRPTDVAQANAITYNYLQGTKPVSELKVNGGDISNSANSNSQSQSNSNSSSSHSSNSNKSEKKSAFTSPSSSRLLSASKFKPKMNNHKKKEEEKNDANDKTVNYQKSVVQVFHDSIEGDYDEPTKTPDVGGGRGSGLVITNGGKYYILTNAHCAANALEDGLSVRLADETDPTPVKLVHIDHHVDLALLEVEDPEFIKKAEPVELGDMVKQDQSVMVIGYPMGGSEISFSKGIVSRMEVRDYVHSGDNMFQVQIDAAVNSGNSGGPVFSGNKVVGMAFQGYGGHQGLSYMIPADFVIKHFLEDIFKNGKKYGGFPILPITTESIKSKRLREHFHMKPGQNGIMIKHIDNLSDAYNKLKPKDILLQIDDYIVHNNHTIIDPKITNNPLNYQIATHMKHMGDTVNLKILRQRADGSGADVLDIPVILDSVPHSTEKVPAREFEKMPTYFISSGFRFIPLTRNYLESNGSDLEELRFMPEGYTISEVPKKHPDEQFVVIDNIYQCDETKGYEYYHNSLVKEINGITINNIRDVVKAMEGNKKATHLITTTDDRIIVVKNMSEQENRALLKKFHVKDDRSEDLGGARPLSPKLSSDRSKEEKRSSHSYSRMTDSPMDTTSNNNSSNSNSSNSSSSHSNSSNSNSSNGNASNNNEDDDSFSDNYSSRKSSSKKMSLKRKASSMLESDEEIEENDEIEDFQESDDEDSTYISKLSKKADDFMTGKGSTPGTKSYAAFLDKLERKAGHLDKLERIADSDMNADEEDELDEDYEPNPNIEPELDLDEDPNHSQLHSNSQQQEDEQEQQSTDKESKKPKRLIKFSDRNRFFSPKGDHVPLANLHEHSKKRVHWEDEQEANSSRKKRKAF